MAASSSSLARKHGIDKYEVFISFRGSDVRRGFLSHLCPALKAKQIHCFTDSELERGKDINGNLFRIIEQSDLSIVIFSQNYPKSVWCLEELEKIHESMKQRQQIIVPVFYEVNPSDVQHLKRNYAIRLQKWRDALVEISNLSGFDSKNFLNDAELIVDIVDAVSKKLSEICPIISHKDGLFGIDSSINDVEQLLRLDLTSDVRMVGIWGMGGIGKTTIAHKLFDKIKNKFDGHCFLANVRETLSRDGQEKVLEKMIQELLKDRNIRIISASTIDDFIKRRLRQVKVILVLDDVHTCMQLNSLLESSDSFGPGSRIIVTSRDSQVLRDGKLRSDVYEVKQLKDDEALALLSWHAFGQNKPQQGYENISQEVVAYAHGVPLALAVLGSQLKHKEIGFWEEAFKKVRSTSPMEIKKIMRISFDNLDREEKNIFLDISCFFNRRLRHASEDILECLGFHASVGISQLIDKSLIKDDGGWIDMHDLLEQMGKEIVAEEKEIKGQQSRLWTYDDIKDALTNNTGSENVEAIQFNNYPDGEIDIGSEAFIHMHKLRYLDFESVTIKCPKGLNFLPNGMRYLRWENCPLKKLPSNYNADKLVVLELRSSHLQEINWSQPLMNLKRISLEFSHSLIRISDLALAPNLEMLDLMGCYNLVEIGSSLENLNRLTSLDVEFCKSLFHLPELPCSIKELKLEESGLRQLPSRIGSLTLLEELSLNFCDKLESLPSSISGLSSLESISLCDCCNLQTLPEDFGNLKSLKELDASCSGLIKLPQSTQNLINLRALNISGCKDLQYLPALPPNLEILCATFISDDVSSSKPLMNLKIISLQNSQSLIRISDLAFAPNLEELVLSGCENLVEIGSFLENLNKLVLLDVEECKSLSHLPELPFSIKKLKLKWSGLRQLPSRIGTLTHVKKLSLSFCGKLESLPSSISNLSSLETISLVCCRNLRQLPENIGSLKSLKELDASQSGLNELPQSIKNLQNLRKLNVSSCKELRYLPALPPNLEMLYATNLLDDESSSIIDQYISKVNSKPTKVHHLCVNGSQVPEWMMYGNECGFSVSLDLETHGHSIDFIYCVVLSSNCCFGPLECSKLEAVLQISYTNYCKDRFDYDSIVYDYDPCHDSYEEKRSYVVLWKSSHDCKFVKQVLFQPTLSECGHQKIIKCGVHPIIDHTKRKHPDNDEDLKIELDLQPLYHDFVEQMGQESFSGHKESMLFNYDLVKEALTNNIGTGNVEAIQLHSFCEDEIEIDSEAFIHKPSFLYLEDEHIECPKGPEFLPNCNKLFKWTGYPPNFFTN